MTERIPLTVIMIVNRADQRLKQALTSVGFADEILIIDNHSQQNWTEFTDLPIKIIKHENPIVDFSSIKNKYSPMAKNKWLLFLDSDEVVPSDLAGEIKQVITQNRIAGFYLKRLDFFYGKALHYGEVGNVWILRLVKKEAITFVRPVHELAKINGPTRRLKSHLLHHPHQSIAEFYQKIIKYAYLEAEYRFQKGDRFSGMEMVVYPLAKFKWNYCFKLGFMDGMRGLIYATMMSLHSFLVRIRLYELSNQLNEKS